MKKILKITGVFILVNIFIFLIYRIFFLYSFLKENKGIFKIIKALLYGIRIDISLFGIEISSILILLFIIFSIKNKNIRIFKRIYIKVLFWSFWTLTFIHILSCFSDIQFFEERNMHVGSMFLAYITQPSQLIIAMMPFFKEHFFLIIIFFISSILFFVIGKKFILEKYILVEQNKDSLLLTKKRDILIYLCLIILSFIASLQIVIIKKTKCKRGWVIKFACSRYYTNLDNFILNQSIINPLQELIRVDIPSYLKVSVPYKLEKEKAFKIAFKILNINNPINKKYPLYRKFKARYNFKIKNIVILQIEGLSQSIIDKKENNKFVMEYLNKLIKKSLYFPWTFQSFNATAGAIFSTSTSLHKCAFEEKTKRFTSFEMKGYYGSFPSILGKKEYEHYFFQAYRQSYTDFITFMSNQGYKSYGYDYFSNILKKRGLSKKGEDLQGLFDEYLFKIASEILEKCNKNFVAYFMTVTSHSPWNTPKDFKKFKNNILNCFAYVDYSIQTFIEGLKKRLPTFNQTLFVIVADHCSVTFTDNLLEHIRIPLIFYSPQLEKFIKKWRKKAHKKILASEVDILPTILDMLGRTFYYSGMGHSLLDDKIDNNRGLISSTRKYSYYIKEDLILYYNPFEDDIKLYKINNNNVILKDISSDYKDFNNIKDEYFALYETSKHLIKENRVFPLKSIK